MPRNVVPPHSTVRFQGPLKVHRVAHNQPAQIRAAQRFTSRVELQKVAIDFDYGQTAPVDANTVTNRNILINDGSFQPQSAGFAVEHNTADGPFFFN